MPHRKPLQSQRFQILRRLGSGGMGVVYEALDREHGGRIALKSLKDLDPAALSRLKNEFRVLQGLHHPNLVSLGELIEESGQWFFTMELVEGVDFLGYVRGATSEGTSTTRMGTAAASTDGDDRTRSTTATVSVTPLPQGPLPAEPGPLPLAAAAFDEGKLRSALIQLASGLAALHAAQKVHCDIKPSNILVTPQGRVVLLDFGLTAEAGTRQLLEGDPERVVGTPAYMAPEHAAGEPVGPEADWYSVGVLLYEALAGRRPFGGSGAHAIAMKQQLEPLPLHAVLSSVPADLDALCRDLLRVEPRKRPTAEQVLSRLQAPAAQRPPPGPSAPLFVGRTRELAELAAALEEARKGAAAAVLVEGESGLGKTTLARRFTESLQAAQQGVLVLAGRCYERESVPFKAFDGVVDRLADHLVLLRDPEVAALLPASTSLVAHAFPTLRRVAWVERLQGAQTLVQDPHQARARLFAAFRHMLATLAERRPLVVVIDDLQWADADSLALLSELMRPPNAPALLLIATARSSLEGTVRAALGRNVRHLQLRPLPRQESHLLASMLLDAPDEVTASSIAAEAEGHPLFIQELTRFVRSRPAGLTGRVPLNEALHARIQALEEPARRLLELLAVSGQPLMQQVLARAAGMSFAESTRHVAVLRAVSLARTSGPLRSDDVEPYHDRVRETVSLHLSALRRQECHAQLAAALEQEPSTGHEVLAFHWQGAGEPKRASREAVLAAEEASEALAFDRAARLYRQALELGAPEGEAGLSLRIKLAEALANAAQAVEAGEELLAAAAQADPELAPDLERRAAEQFLRSGHIDRGTELLDRVLRKAGMRLPQTPGRILASLVLERAKVAVRGVKFRERPEDRVPAALLRRTDLAWSTAVGTLLVNPGLGFAYQARHLLLALSAGEPRRVLRAMAMEPAMRAMGRTPWARIEALGQENIARARKLGDAYLTALASWGLAVGCFEHGRYRQAVGLLESAEATLQDRCVGVEFELTGIRWYTARSRAFLGEWGQLSEQLPVQVRQAVQRDDRFAAAILSSGWLNVAWLVPDTPGEARRVVDDGMRYWSHRGFHVEHAIALFAHANIDLYRGEGERAYQRLQEAWSKFDSALLMRVKTFRYLMFNQRARAALASAPGALDPEQRYRLAELDARRSTVNRVPGAEAMAGVIHAALAATRGERARAIQRLTDAEVALDARDLAITAAAARWRRGELVGGAEGQALIASAQERMRQERIERPEAVVAMLAPGFEG